MRDYSDREILALLGLPVHTREVDIETDWDGSRFKDVPCHVDENLAAAVFVDYYDVRTVDADRDIYEPGTLHEVAFSLVHAPTALPEIWGEAFHGGDDYSLKLVINGWALAYGTGQVAA